MRKTEYIGLEKHSISEESPAHRELVKRITSKAIANGVFEQIELKILIPLRIQSLETAEIHELRAVQSMLFSLCLFSAQGRLVP